MKYNILKNHLTCILVPFFLIIFINTSCQTTPLNATQNNFTIIHHERPSINHPVIAWTYHQSEDDIRISSMTNSPLIDQHGYLYFIDRGTIKSLDAEGQLRFEKEGFFSGENSFLIAKEGIIARSRNKVVLMDHQGSLLWEVEVGWIDGLFLSPKGSLIVFSYDQAIALDAKGNTKWTLGLSEDLFFYDQYFFDTEGNGYFFFSIIDKETYIPEEGCYDFDDYLISISPEGQLRWKNLLTQDRNLISRFVPSNHLIKDTFLLAYYQNTYLHQDEGPIKIIAYDTQGNEAWETIIDQSVLSYAVNQSNQFYIAFNDQAESKAHLRCYSSNGDELWGTTLEGRVTSSPGVDDQDHIYIGVINNKSSYLCAFDNQGNEQWNLLVDRFMGLAHPPLLDPFRGLYLTASAKTLIFYVLDKE